MIERNAARVLLIAAESVLLIRGCDPGRPEAGWWWLTPGGGIEDGESVGDAAVREVLEETGFRLHPDQLGPVVATRVAEFEFDGRAFRQAESFFAVEVATFVAGSTGWDELEQRSLSEHRWWTLDELSSTDETVYPRELATIVRAVLGGYITSPLEVSGD